MPEILAFIGGLLLAVQVWRWFGALALLIFSPFAFIASLFGGSSNSRRSQKLTWRPFGWARSAIAIFIIGLSLLLVLPLLVFSLAAFSITTIDKRLNQYTKQRIKQNRSWLEKGLNAGLWIDEKVGIHISGKVKRQRRRNWKGNLLDRVIAHNEVPYSGTVGVLLLITAFLIALI